LLGPSVLLVSDPLVFRYSLRAARTGSQQTAAWVAVAVTGFLLFGIAISILLDIACV
jgi:hypothetical protein